MIIKRILLSALLLLTVEIGWADGLQPSSLTLEKGSEAKLAVGLQNTERSYAAFQFDLVLPEGLSVAKNDAGSLKASLNTERATSHTLGSSDLGNRTYRFIAYSLSNTAISGTEGDLVYITVKADANVSTGNFQAKLTNVVLSANATNQFFLDDMTFQISITAPSTPDTPETPDTPDTPSTPDTPTTPDTPSTPDTPTTPDTPGTPDTPSTPEPIGTTFEEDVDDSSTNETAVKFTVTDSGSSDTPTVSISSDDEGASGKVEIPDEVTHNGVKYKVTEVAEGAFQNNTGLTDVIIPASVSSIKDNAFAGCTNLQSITIYVAEPINLSAAAARGFTRAGGWSVFDGVNKETCILYVPEGSVDKYKAAPVWKEFKNILPIKTSTGIQGVKQTEEQTFDVFSLSGQKVKSKATSLDGLPRGIYIVKGKKVMK